MRKCLFAAAATVFTVACILILSGLFAPGLAHVVCVPVEQNDIVVSITVSGRVQESAVKQYYAVAPASVSAVYVGLGDHVSAGDPLVEFESEQAHYSTGGTAQNGLEEALSGVSDSAMVFAALESMGLLDALESGGAPQAGESESSKLITAPFDGVISELNAHSDAAVNSSQPVVSLVSMDGMTVRASVGEHLIADIAVGQGVIITGEGFRGRSYAGVVTAIAPVAKQGTGGGATVDVTIAIDAPDEYLRPGYTASVRITTAARERVLLVPYEAVQQDGENMEYVFVYQDGKVMRRDILTGAELSSCVEVLAGLEPGMSVVVDSDRALENGGGALPR